MISTQQPSFHPFEIEADDKGLPQVQTWDGRVIQKIEQVEQRYISRIPRSALIH